MESAGSARLCSRPADTYHILRIIRTLTVLCGLRLDAQRLETSTELTVTTAMPDEISPDD